MYDSFFRSYIDTHHYFTHTYALTHAHARAPHIYVHAHTPLFVHY